MGVNMNIVGKEYSNEFFKIKVISKNEYTGTGTTTKYELCVSNGFYELVYNNIMMNIDTIKITPNSLNISVNNVKNPDKYVDDYLNKYVFSVTANNALIHLMREFNELKNKYICKEQLNITLD